MQKINSTAERANKQGRDSNLELLRIISMFMIVLFHASIYLDGNINFNHVLTPNMAVLIAIGGWGRLGVALFVLISSWFLTENKIGGGGRRGRKIIMICAETIFYSVAINIALQLFHIEAVTVKDYAKAVLSPFITQYWFISCYLLLIIFYPFLNRVIHTLNNKTLLGLTSFLFFFSAVWGTLFGGQVITMCGDFIKFLTLYFIAACMRRFPGNWFSRKAGLKAGCTYGITVFLCVAFCYAGTRLDSVRLLQITTKILNNNSVFVDILAIFIFYFFLQKKRFSAGIINIPAGSMFGVYLIHDHFLLRRNIWDCYMHLGEAFNTQPAWMFVLTLFKTAGLVLLAGVIIDFFRRYLIEKPLLKTKAVQKIFDYGNELLLKWLT